MDTIMCSVNIYPKSFTSGFFVCMFWKVCLATEGINIMQVVQNKVKTTGSPNSLLIPNAHLKTQILTEPKLNLTQTETSKWIMAHSPLLRFLYYGPTYSNDSNSTPPSKDKGCDWIADAQAPQFAMQKTFVWDLKKKEHQQIPQSNMQHILLNLFFELKDFLCVFKRTELRNGIWAFTML